jgi:muramoyltetrapeptide carboxypeptidase
VARDGAPAGRCGSAALTAASRFGKPLPDGGTIGVASPATGVFRRSEVERGVEWWESHGYRVRLAESVFARDDWVAGTPEQRARDLEALFADAEVDAVQCLRGGYGSAQLIPLLDFDVVTANPKPFVGYSDITALHESIRQRSGLATFYGPGLASVGRPEAAAFTREQLLARLRGATGDVPRSPDDPYVRSISGGRVTAPLVGGCLWLLQHTMGTPWEFRADGAILFFEDVNAAAWQIDGMLIQLGAAGKLDGVAGVVVGEIAKSEFPDVRSGFPRVKSIEEVLEHRLGPLGVPVLYGLPLGHGTHLATLPLGVTCTLDADARTLTVDEPAVRA